MKILVFIIFGFLLFFLLNFLSKTLKAKIKTKWIAVGVAVFITLIFVTGAFYSSLQPDKQCLYAHESVSSKPSNTLTAKDFFELGNYDYEKGDCKNAIKNYSEAIKLDPNFAQAYNNRAYTSMRMQNYRDALPDLNKAIEIRPDYVNALMNRGDIYNYYYNVDRKRAIEDYKKVLILVKDPEERRRLGVCGHKLIAQNNGWGPKIYFSLMSQGFSAGCNI